MVRYVTEIRAVCMDCDSELEPAPTAGAPRPNCRNCGSDRARIYASIHSSIGVSSSVRGQAASNNDSMARLGELRDAITRCRRATGARRISEAQWATKNALEALHGLEDGRRHRGEWSNSAWTADEIEVWKGFMGIRNAGHHSTLRVVVLIGGSDHLPSEHDLQWTTETLSIRWPDQASAFASKLAGNAVLPSLDAAAALVERALGV
jgi:hypothetical protein